MKYSRFEIQQRTRSVSGGFHWRSSGFQRYVTAEDAFKALDSHIQTGLYHEDDFRVREVTVQETYVTVEREKPESRAEKLASYIEKSQSPEWLQDLLVNYERRINKLEQRVSQQ